MPYHLRVSEEDVRRELALLGHTGISDDTVAAIRRDLLKLIKDDLRKLSQDLWRRERVDLKQDPRHPHQPQTSKKHQHLPDASTPLVDLSYRQKGYSKTADSQTSKWEDGEYSGESGYSDGDSQNSSCSQKIREAKYKQKYDKMAGRKHRRPGEEEDSCYWREKGKLPTRRHVRGGEEEEEDGYWKKGKLPTRNHGRREEEEEEEDGYWREKMKLPARNHGTGGEEDYWRREKGKLPTRKHGKPGEDDDDSDWRRGTGKPPPRHSQDREDEWIGAGVLRPGGGVSDEDTRDGEADGGRKKLPRKGKNGEQIKSDMPSYPSRPDPVNLYHFYKAHWDKFKVPGEDPRSKLRWGVRTRLFYAE